MSQGTRRKFLKSIGGGAAVVAGLGAAPAVQAAGAGDRMVAALIGCGGQGPGVAGGVKGAENVSVAYACDPDEKRAADAAKGLEAKAIADLRRILDDKSVDAVVIATPDHWHAPAAILALDAGKHVYVEKPCSHNIREGRLLVEAAKRNKRVVQHGTQSRSNGMIIQAIQALRDGVIGDVLIAKAYNVQRRGSIGKRKPGSPPPGFDYDLWVGPAESMPWQENRHHYKWHWWYNYGTGDAGNDGVHEIDIARWGLGVETHPTTITGMGGKYAYDDDQQFPDTVYANFEYPGDGKVGSRRQLFFEMRLWSRYGMIEGNDNGNAFYGTKGWMFLTKRGKVKVYNERNEEFELPGKRPNMPSHREDFILAIREGRKPQADIEKGHLSATLCHLGNIAVRLRRSLQFDPEREVFIGDDEANKLISRKYRQGGHWAIPKGGV